MKSVELKLNGTSVKVVNLDATQVIAKVARAINGRIINAVAFASTMADVTSKGVASYVYDVCRSLMQGLNAIVASLFDFKKCADYDACASTALTDATEGKKYFATDTKKMYTNSKVSAKTLDEGVAKTIHSFTKVADIDEEDVNDYNEGDLVYDSIDNLFYEVEVEEEEKQFTPVAGEQSDLYVDQDEHVYSFTEGVLTIETINYTAETPTQEDIDQRTIGYQYYVVEDGKLYTVIATEVLQLVEDATISNEQLWKDLADSNKLYEWTGTDMVAYTGTDTTGYANGYISVNVI